MVFSALEQELFQNQMRHGDMIQQRFGQRAAWLGPGGNDGDIDVDLAVLDRLPASSMGPEYAQAAHVAVRAVRSQGTVHRSLDVVNHAPFHQVDHRFVTGEGGARKPHQVARAQLGGGIRDAKAVEAWFELGVARVVMGSAALKDPDFVKQMAKEWEGGIVVAVDAKDGMVATEGWAEVSDVPVVDLARRFEDAGVASLLFTDIGRDGLLKGANIDATLDLARRVDIPVIASGGVKGLDDIHILSLNAHEGIEGVITGRALYEGRLDLAAAIAMGARA